MAAFKAIKLHDDSNQITITFEDNGNPITVTVDLPDLNILVAASMNALREAEKRASQFPTFSLSEAPPGESFTHLPINKWEVTTIPDHPDLVVFRILAAGGLLLNYFVDRTAVRGIADALAAQVGADDSTPIPRSRH